MAAPELRTERLIMREMQPADAPVIAEAVNDQDISRWTPLIPYPYGLSDAEDFIAKQVTREIKPTLAIWDATAFVGCIGIGKELGYWLRKSAWGQGYATEAARAVMARYFANPNAGPLASSYLEGNGPSARVLQKLGFSITGKTGRATPIATGVEVTTHKLLMTPEQYHALNPWIVETSRLRLRPLLQADAPAISEAAGNHQVAPMILNATIPWPVEDVEVWIERSRWRGRMPFRIGIERDGAIIGAMGVSQPNPDLGEISYFLDPDHWGGGLATEAVSALIAQVMARFALNTFQAEAYDDNPGSARVLEKLGFQRVGATTGCRSAARVEDAPVSLYRLTRAAFENRQ